MPALKLLFLGSLQIEFNDRKITFSRRKAVALLSYLVITGRPHQRDTLASMFWPEQEHSKARAALRRHLWTLNDKLGGLISADRESIEIQAEDIWNDVEAFRSLVSDCRTHGHPEKVVCEICIENLVHAADLYRDDFLIGFTLPDCPEFDAWQFFEDESLRRDSADILSKLVGVNSASHNFEKAITYARRWLALDPLREDVHRQLMQLYDWAGQRSAALRQFEVCRQILESELGIEPESKTIHLYETIRLGDHQTLPVVEYTPPETHYAQSGDHHIAYQIYGNGPVDLVWIAGFVTHLEVAWQEPALVEFRNHLASFSRLILFDKRGRGLSDRTARPPDVEEMVEDTLSVMDAANVQQAVILGSSEGGAVAASFGATHPERTRALILYGAFIKGARSDDFPWAPPDAFWEEWSDQMLHTWGQPQALKVFAPSKLDDGRFRKWWAEFLRTGASPGDITAILETQKDLDVRDALPAIKVPTLVLHRRGDQAVYVGSARYLAAHVPDAVYVELEGADHFWWIGETDTILEEIEQFISALSA